MNDVHEQLGHLVTLYGPDKVKAAAQKLLDVSTQTMPAEYIPVLSPQALEATLKELAFVGENLQAAVQHRMAVDGNKAELIEQKTQLETAVKLTEAEAFMNAAGEGKEQYGLIGDKKILLNNEANRDAYRRSYSAKERKHLAEICGELNAIDVDLARANDTLQATAARANSIKAKAHLQAALLNFLAGRGA